MFEGTLPSVDANQFERTDLTRVDPGKHIVFSEVTGFDPNLEGADVDPQKGSYLLNKERKNRIDVKFLAPTTSTYDLASATSRRRITTFFMIILGPWLALAGEAFTSTGRNASVPNKGYVDVPNCKNNESPCIKPPSSVEKRSLCDQEVFVSPGCELRK